MRHRQCGHRRLPAPGRTGAHARRDPHSRLRPGDHLTEDANAAEVPAPRAMLLVVIVLGIQALALVGAAVSFVLSAFGTGELVSSLFGQDVKLLIFDAGVGGAAR